MHPVIRNMSTYGLALVIGVSFALPVRAQEADFTAGSRVEGRIGSNWDHCTVIGARRPTGGYMLRCDSHPDQETVFAASDVRAMQGVDHRPARKRPVATRAAATASAVSVNARAFKTIPPRVGVYGCMDQDAHETPGLQFGLLDGTTYSTFDGGRGRYVYSAQSGILTFTTGPMAGLRRIRATERTFDILDERGRPTAFACPWSPKNPRKLHW
jgi:hypothetical protein